MCLRTSAYTFACVHAYIMNGHTYMNVWKCTCKCVHTHVCIHVCVYIQHVCVYIHTHKHDDIQCTKSQIRISLSVEPDAKRLGLKELKSIPRTGPLCFCTRATNGSPCTVQIWAAVPQYQYSLFIHFCFLFFFI